MNYVNEPPARPLKEPKYRPTQRVEVTSGLYQGAFGVIKRHDHDMNREVCYLIDMDDGQETVLSEREVSPT